MSKVGSLLRQDVWLPACLMVVLVIVMVVVVGGGGGGDDDDDDDDDDDGGGGGGGGKDNGHGRSFVRLPAFHHQQCGGWLLLFQNINFNYITL